MQCSLWFVDYGRVGVSYSMHFRFFTIYQLVKVGMMNYRESFDYYNNVTGCAVGILPFIKVPFMRRYILYPFSLFGFDVFGDWRERHGKN